MQMDNDYLASFIGGQAVLQWGPGCEVYHGVIEHVGIEEELFVIRFSWLKRAVNAHMGLAPTEVWNWWDASLHDWRPMTLSALISWEREEGLFINDAFNGDDTILTRPGSPIFSSADVKDILDKRHTDDRRHPGWRYLPRP